MVMILVLVITKHIVGEVLNNYPFRGGECIWSYTDALSAYASNAHITGDFYALRLDKSTFCLYEYHPEEASFLVKNLIDAQPHKIDQILNFDLKSDGRTQKWWSAVFFASNSNVHYDSYYDRLAVADDTSLTFGELLAQLKVEMVTWNVVLRNKPLFLFGEEADNMMLAYLCQVVFGAGELLMGDRLPAMSSQEMRFLLPMDNVSLAGKVCGELTWQDLIDTQLPADYTAGGIAYKHLLISAEYDKSANLIITGKDSYGNQKTNYITTQL